DDHSSDFKTKSASTSLNALLEETNNFNNSLPEFTTFSNVLCDAEYESDSSDDQSCSDEDVLETIVLKPLSKEEVVTIRQIHKFLYGGGGGVEVYGSKEERQGVYDFFSSNTILNAVKMMLEPRADVSTAILTVTYTSVPSPVEGYSDIGSPEVNGPPSPDYVPGPEEPEQAPLLLDYVSGLEEPEQAPLSLDYMPGPEEPEGPEQAPPSHVYLPYVPEPVYPEYIPPEDNVFPTKEQPLPIAATPTADSPGYILEFDPNRDPEKDDEEDPEEDPADYPADSTVVVYELLIMSHIRSQEVRESSAAGATRQNEPAIARDDPYSLVREELYGFVERVDFDLGHPISKELDYGITDTWDELVGANEEIVPTTLHGVNQRVTDLSTIIEQETTIMYGMMEDTQNNRSQLRGRVNLLYRDIPVHHRLAVMIEREAKMTREAWGLSMDASENAHSDVISLRTTLVAQHALILDLQAADRRRQWAIKELLAADHKRQVQ
nr:hypothetical protein [Tanacetum cinerariifolium]